MGYCSIFLSPIVLSSLKPQVILLRPLLHRDVVVQIKKIFEEHKDSLSKSKMMGKVLGMVPPRMHKWMLAKFPEPAAWLQARLNFTRWVRRAHRCL